MIFSEEGENNWCFWHIRGYNEKKKV